MAAVLLLVFGVSLWTAAVVAAVGLVVVTERVGWQWTRRDQGRDT
jgi:hypothetical protein